MAKVSILTASYNYENYIKETIESVINQTFSDWEMIIVDDGSKDNSLSVIKEYYEKDSRIKLFCHDGGVNKGLAETIKLGLQKVTSDWVIFLESDDTIEPDYIEEKLRIIEENPNVNFIFNDINMFGDSDAIEEYVWYFEKQKRILSKIKFPANMLRTFKNTHTNLIPTFSCVMIKKDLTKNLSFETPVKKALDKFLWLQIAKNGVFYYTDKKLTNWRMHKNSYVNNEYTCDFADYQFDCKRADFLYGKYAFFRKIILFLNFVRKMAFRIHKIGDNIEIIIFGKKVFEG